MARYKMLNGKRVQLTAEEETARNLEEQSWIDTKAERQLEQIKSLRLQKLQETDFYALQDVSMSNEMKTWRLNLRNIPQDYTTEEEYDLLLACDENGNLTHSVWSKP
jgi:hypothetical protein